MSWTMRRTKKRWNKHIRYIQHYEPYDMFWRLKYSYGWGFMEPRDRPHARLMVKQGRTARRAKT